MATTGLTDLLARTAALVDIASPSRAEGPIVDLIEAELRSQAHLDVTRVGDNLVARTSLGRSQRVILAGHTDTVPAADNATARIEDGRLFGVGSADMKGGLAVMLELASTLTEPVVDITYVFYAREEIASSESGLGELFESRPELLVGDIAILGEPTDARIEAGVAVMCSVGTFARVLDELLSNAFAYARSRVRVSLTRGSESVTLTVEDDGPGIADEERDLVFDRFARGSGSVPGGSGLGLALVREAARGAGGDAVARGDGSGGRAAASAASAASTAAPPLKHASTSLDAS